MENKIQITFKNHLVSLKWFFIYIIVTLILLFFFYYMNGVEGLYIMLILLLPQLLPTIYLHLKYYLINKLDIYYVYEDKFEHTNNNIKTVYLSSEIKSIMICKSANLDSWGIPLFIFENYYYARIFLKNGNSLVLTSLLDNKIEDKLKIINNVDFNRSRGFSYFPNW